MYLEVHAFGSNVPSKAADYAPKYLFSPPFHSAPTPAPDDRPQFDDDFYEFRCSIKELERRLGAVVSLAFDDCATVYGRFKLLDSFEGLLERPIIQVCFAIDSAVTFPPFIYQANWLSATVITTRHI